MSNHKPSKKTFGRTSAKFIGALQQQGMLLFSLSEAVEVYGGTKRETTKFLSDLVKRGVLARIKSGMYLILQTGLESTQLTNWPIIARELASPCKYMLSYYSAMRLHGMTTHPLFDVYITLSKRRKARKLHNITYHFIYSKVDNVWGESTHWLTKQDKVIVTDLERTILDCLDRPNLCGGIKEIVRGIWVKQKQIQWQKLVAYADKFHSKATVKRLGFILECLELGADIFPSLLEIISLAKDYVLLDPSGPKEGRYISRWRVRVNISVDEIKASIWG